MDHRFKVGDTFRLPTNGEQITVERINFNACTYEFGGTGISIEYADRFGILLERPAPEFKRGDTVRFLDNGNTETIQDVIDTRDRGDKAYMLANGTVVSQVYMDQHATVIAHEGEEPGFEGGDHTVLVGQAAPRKHTTHFTIEHKYQVGDTLVWGGSSRVTERTIEAIAPSSRVNGGSYVWEGGRSSITLVDENPNITVKPKERSMNGRWMVEVPGQGDVWTWKNEPRQDVHPTGAVCFKVAGTIENPTIERVW